MHVLILAAGYATRLYPLTRNKAKPLLEVAGKPMIQWVADHLSAVPGIEKIHIVTNNKFAADFEAWAAEYQTFHATAAINVINDRSTSDDDKLGAIGDIHLVVNQENLSHSDLLVVAGDNLFSQSLENFAAYARQHPAAVAVYDVGDLEEIRKYNNIEIDDQQRIVHFEEKPQNPKNTVTGIALYYFSKETVPMFNQYIEEGNNPDQPGRFIQWLYPRIPVRTHEVEGIWFDIGSKETLEEANEVFKQFV